VEGPQGIQCLASALIDENFTIADAMNLLNVCNELYTFEHLGWEDITDRLRSWLENQDGLKVNSCPIFSTEDVLKVYRLLCRKASSMRIVEDIGFVGAVF
jgi:hypothetical protein